MADIVMNAPELPFLVTIHVDTNGRATYEWPFGALQAGDTRSPGI